MPAPSYFLLPLRKREKGSGRMLRPGTHRNSHHGLLSCSEALHGSLWSLSLPLADCHGEIESPLS